MTACALGQPVFLRHVRYAVEGLLAHIIYGFFWLLPMEKASSLGGYLLSKAGPHLKGAKIAGRNLDRAFPEKTQDEKNIILNGMWNNLGRVIGEYPHLHHIWKNAEVIGIEHLEAARDNGKAAILFSAHTANWEVPILRQKTGLDLHIVYRKPNNRWVEKLLSHARSLGGAGYIEKGAGGARAIVTLLRAGGVVGMLVDQKLNEGVAIPFFGHDAMTAPAIAHFALKFGCPLYPFRVERIVGCRFRLTAFPPLPVIVTGGKDADVKLILTDINMLLESWIREKPEQWLWVHRRWPKP